MRNRSVFILSLFDTGLYAGQLFAKYGYKVLGFDFNPKNIGFKSSLIESFLTGDPLTNAGEVVDFLIEKSEKCDKKPLLIAASEIYLRFIVDNREVLENHFLFILPSNNTLNGILDKSEQLKMAEEIGIKVPRYKVIKQDEDVSCLYDFDEFPVIIKGADQHVWKQAALPKSYIADSRDSLFKIGEELLNKNVSYIVQNLIAGSIENNFEQNILAYNNEIILSSTIKKVRQYYEPYGAASAIQLCENKKTKTLAEKFILMNSIDGFSNTEFKLNPIDNEYYFIECNARIWLQLKLTEHIGLSYISSYAELFGDKITKKQKRTNFAPYLWVDFPADLINILKNLPSRPAENIKSIMDYRHARSFGLFDIKDIKPFFSSIFKI